MAFRVRISEAVKSGEAVQAGAAKGLLHDGDGDYFEFVEGGTLKVHKATTNTTTYYGAGSWLLIETLDGQEPGRPVVPQVY